MPPRRKSSGAGETASKASAAHKRKKSTSDEEKKAEPKEDTKTDEPNQTAKGEEKEGVTGEVNGNTASSTDKTNGNKREDEKADGDQDKDVAAKGNSNEENKSSETEAKEPPAKKQKSETATTKKSTKLRKEPQSGSRKSSRGGNPSKEQLLRYLISSASEQLCRPDDEAEFLSSNPNAKTYSGGGASPLNPFEELICALVLSRPISHRLGLRTIRTIFNAPYEFTSAKRVVDAGDGDRHQALWDAKTQHKDKTASQIGLAAEVVMEKYTAAGAGSSGGEVKSPAKGKKGGKGAAGGSGGEDSEGTTLGKLRADCENDIDEILDILQKDIKGFGKTTAAIFRRRVQWVWPEAYPFVDERTADGLKELGLPLRAEALVEVLEENWDALKNSEEGKELAGDGEETRKRRAFTIILERATSAKLEGKGGEILQGAAQA